MTAKDLVRDRPLVARGTGQRLLGLLTGEQPIIEKRRTGLFIPAHPKPHQDRPGGLRLLAGAKRNLISIWTNADFRAGSGTARVLGRQIVVANRPEDIKYVLATGHANFERKSPQMRRALEYLLGDGLFISDGATWAERRPLVADIVHKTRMPDFAPFIEAAVGELAEDWASRPNQPMNAHHEMAALTSDIIARAVFGDRLDQASARAVIDGFTAYQSEVDSTNLAYFAGLDDGLPIRRTRKIRAAVEAVHGVIDRIVAQHMRGDGDHRSMLDSLVRQQQKRPDLNLTAESLRNEAATIFMAGHETTAATLTWVWYLLANSPWAERTLVAEIRRVCGKRAPSFADLPALSYCRAVIEETLRLYPPVPFLSRQPREDDRIGDIDVEAGSLVLVVPWLIHRQRGLWDRPNQFRPERFLEGRPVPYSYIPFAAGPRICAGMGFGLAEAILSLATLAQRFRVRIPDGHKVTPVCRLTLRPQGGLPIVASLR